MKNEKFIIKYTDDFGNVRYVSQVYAHSYGTSKDPNRALVFNPMWVWLTDNSLKQLRRALVLHHNALNVRVVHARKF